MFGFLACVRGKAVLTCFYLSLGVAVEICTVRFMGSAADAVSSLRAGGADAPRRFLGRISSSDPAVGHLRRLLLLVGLFSVLIGVLRYLKEVSNSKMSMKMVFHPRGGSTTSCSASASDSTTSFRPAS